MSSAQERSEEATPKRRAKARAHGQSARSMLAGPALSVLAAAAAVQALLASAISWRQAFIAASASSVWFRHCCDTGQLLHAARACLATSGLWTPVAIAWIASVCVAATTSLLCGSLGFAPRVLALRLGRLSPAGALARLVNADNLWHVALCAACAACVAALALPPVLASIQTAAVAGALSGALAALWQGVTALWWRAALVLAALAAAEIVVARRRHARSLRMTPRELQEERAETEARPEAKQRRKTVGARRARSLRIAAIRQATAVIANPSHLAVALRYAPPALDVPVVVARGADLTAAIVRAAAQAFDVPIIESPELARTLYATVEVDEPIPEDCYAAVAAIFAWIVRTRGSLRTQEPRSQ